MATSKLPTSVDFFKQLSPKIQQVRIAIYFATLLVQSASCCEQDDEYLWLLLDQLKSLIARAHELLDSMEKHRCKRED